MKILVSSCFGQGLNNIWIMGYSGSGSGYAILNFDSIPVSVQHPNLLNISFQEAFAGISNKLGKLLFYTNGIKINNSLNQTMLNGSGLNPGPYASNSLYGMTIPQAQIVIPAPNDTNKYYLIHETVDFNASTTRPFHLFYTTIDITLDSGRGAVVQKNISIINDTLIIGNITACKHSNGRDWWIIVHQNNSNLFYTLLVTPGGVNQPSSQIIGNVFNTGGAGQACISPNGKHYAHFHPSSGLDVYDFDRCTGLFSNWQHCDSINDYGGVAFSPNSNVLYVSAITNLYQFNLSDTSNSLQQRKFLVAEWDTTYSPNPPFATTFYLQQLAPDGKIYINSNNSVNRLHVINNPDSIGFACDVAQHSLLIPCLNGSTIPNYPNYFLGADSGSVCDTLMLFNPQTPNSIGNILTVSIYPNPAQNYFNINYQIPKHETTQFTLFNSFGKEVLRKNLFGTSKTHLVYTTDLENGIFFYKFQGQGGKIVILK